MPKVLQGLVGSFVLTHFMMREEINSIYLFLLSKFRGCEREGKVGGRRVCGATAIGKSYPLVELAMIEISFERHHNSSKLTRPELE